MIKVMYVGRNPAYSDLIAEMLPKDRFEFAVRPQLIRDDDEDTLIEVCKDADAVICDYQIFNKRVIDALPKLKLIQFNSIGFNYVDLNYATSKKIAVANCPTYCTNEVADHAVALTLAINRRLFEYARAIHERGEWKATTQVNMHCMNELKIGILGFGAIPRLIARRLLGFGSEVSAYDPYVDQETMAQHGVIKKDFDAFLSESDYIICNVPAFPSTIHMLNKEAFDKCKDGVVFVNTSRGNIPVEADLIEALRSGKIAFAGLDVLDGEQIDPKTNPLCNMDNVIVTPHAGFFSSSSQRKSRIEAGQSLLSFFNGDFEHAAVRNGIREIRPAEE
ncbi:MAG: C-terminal binding protein [Lachnospiraceae bacterium]|nr:C-terminal binding protein [Lachnospiraceae bacterium]